MYIVRCQGVDVSGRDDVDDSHRDRDQERPDRHSGRPALHATGCHFSEREQSLAERERAVGRLTATVTAERANAMRRKAR